MCIMSSNLKFELNLGIIIVTNRFAYFKKVIYAKNAFYLVHMQTV